MWHSVLTAGVLVASVIDGFLNAADFHFLETLC
jgi:hypothetical protein